MTTNETNYDPEFLHLSTQAAADRLGISVKFLRHANMQGHGPARIMPSKRTTWYREQDLRDWVATWKRK